jgi:hypothetical protein
MNTRTLLFPACFGALLLALLAGCSWNKPASESFASVLITNTTPAAVRATTIKVFQESEYHLISTHTNANPIVFDKEGTYGQSIAYNGLVGAHYGQIILNRVKVQLYGRGEGNYRLSCQAFIVQDAGSFTGGHEIKLSNMRGGPYQAILDDIQRRLNPPEKKK